MAKIKVLSTPSGNTLRALVTDGVKIGISSRGLGSVSENRDHVVVQDDFQLICFDVVSEPSTPKAFMDNVVYESKARTITDIDIHSIIEDILNG